MTGLIDQLKRHEGVRSHAYRDNAGYLTIGAGRNIDCDGGLGLSADEIDYLLHNDVDRCFSELEPFDWFSELDDVRQDALINMCFNLGLTRLLHFNKMIDALQNKDFELAAAEALDSRWARQVGDRAVEVASMIELGVYP